ncbi:MAG TPA: D-arabinono-1,4-lactone oxidase [Kofleriaceae bacterium]|jgi:FAD/FMN-containing dehydrogenase|nr:D-arabinono-1,4-lactone oxidase [Kofleriaceae bacterium]
MPEPCDEGATPLVNFGGNVAFAPRHRYAPASEAEVLAVLDRHAGGMIRVVGSLHSWSDDIVSDDVILDLRQFDRVEIEIRDGEIWATIGAGCVLSDALTQLRAAGATLPTIGAVTVQRMAGLISTATHGSGCSSLSHHVAGLRIAAYDPETGKAGVFELDAGDARRAARCALGAAGVILACRVRCVPSYLVEETLVQHDTLDDVLAGEARYPLQQFVLVPYLWQFVVFQRRNAGSERTGRASWWRLIHRAYALLGVDLLLHLIIKLLVTVGRPSWIRGFFRSMFVHLAWKDRAVVDRSELVLTLHHELFKHLEIELFVPASQLAGALAVVRHAIAVFDGSDARPDPAVEAALAGAGLLDELRRGAGSYTHHYPVFIRRVLPDDTLISMTAGAREPFYTISLFCYHEPRTAFYGLADFVARALNRLHRARPHWGKYFPLGFADIADDYPQLPAFRAICDRLDPRGTFRNAYVRRVLGFGADESNRAPGVPAAGAVRGSPDSSFTASDRDRPW